MIKVSDKFIASELTKLDKLKDSLVIALVTLNRDESKYKSIIKLLSEEHEKLETNLVYIKSPDAQVVSLSDIKKIKKEMVEILEEIALAEKQLFAIKGFKKITETDLERCEMDISRLLNIKNHVAEVIEFKK